MGKKKQRHLAIYESGIKRRKSGREFIDEERRNSYNIKIEMNIFSQIRKKYQVILKNRTKEGNEKNMEKLFLEQNKEKGITLIALVITIIVLLILAGVTISALTGENGILNRAVESKESTNIAQLKEQMRLDVMEVQSQNKGKVTKGDLQTIAQKYGGALSEDGTKIIIGEKEIAVIDIYPGTLEKDPPMAKAITVANYGDYVNYNVEIGLDNTTTEHKTDWRIFYNDGTNIFLIASDYVQNTKIPTLEELGMTPNGTYSVYWDSDNWNWKYTGMADVEEATATRYQLGWRAANSADEDENAQATAALLDTSKWSYFAGGIAGAEAVGGPTLEMYTKSWNAKGYTKLHCDNSNSNGYYVGTTSKPTTLSVNMRTDTAGYENTLYYPHQEAVDNDKCYGYWLASPSAWKADYVMYVGYVGDVSNYYYYSDYRGVRPVVYLPSGITGEKDANGIWQIQ